MDKQAIDTLSRLIAFETIPTAKKNEKLETFVKRAYTQFTDGLGDSENPVIAELAEKLSRDVLYESVAGLNARRRIVANWCRTNDPFEVPEPSEATDQEILDHNDIEGTPEQLTEIMGKKGYEKLLKKLRTPKKDGKTKTEIRQEREEHFAQYEPAFPSKKEYSHNSGGTTRRFHWQKNIQQEFVDDHKAFLKEYLPDELEAFEQRESDEEE